MTPLGMAVDPDVSRIFAMVSGAISCGAIDRSVGAVASKARGCESLHVGGDLPHRAVDAPVERRARRSEYEPGRQQAIACLSIAKSRDESE